MGWCKVSGRERIIQHLRAQKEPYDEGSHHSHLDLPNELMPREEPARFTNLLLGNRMLIVQQSPDPCGPSVVMSKSFYWAGGLV